MAKRSSSRKKLPIELWVALIGLLGVLVTAILSSPVVLELVKKESAPTSTQSAAAMPVAQSTSPVNTRQVSETAPSTNGAPNPMALTIVCITAQKGEGTPAKVRADSLRFSSSALGILKELPLLNGQKIPFSSLKSLDAMGIYDTGGLKVEITTVSGDRIRDVVDYSQYDGTKLLGQTEFGSFELRLLDVKHLEFKEEGSCQ